MCIRTRTAYCMERDANGRLTISVPQAEGNESIQVTR